MRDFGKHHQESLTPLLNKLPIGLFPQKERNLSLLFTNNQYSKRGSKGLGGKASLIITFSFLSLRIQVREAFDNHKQKCSDLTEPGFETTVTSICFLPDQLISVFSPFSQVRTTASILTLKGKDTVAQRGDL